MKRALKFLFVFIAVVAVVYGMAGIPNYSAFKTLFENTDGMADGYEYVESTYSLQGLAEFIGDHPEFMSVVSFNVNDPDSGIFYQADTPRTMGTLSNLILLLEYERQVLEGLIDPEGSIDLYDIQRLSLPGINQNAHEAAVEKLRDLENPTLDDAVAAMTEFNSLAIADYLWFRLGTENVENMYSSLDLVATDHPLPFSGLYIFIHPHISDTSRSYSEKEIIYLAERFLADHRFNSEVKSVFEEYRLGLSFIEERDALAYFPHTTAYEMAHLMADLYADKLVSPEVSRRVKEKMRWVLDGGAVQRSFTDYGAIYDNRMGMLSGIDFGTSVYDGHTSAQAVFFDKLPVAFWLHLSANHMQEDYQQRLIWDPALYETTMKEISE